MSKNRDLGNIVGPDTTTGHALTYNSDGTLSFSEVSANLTDLSTYTISADADPATDTNPSAAGALWLNQDTNQLYICIDATADANVWKGLTFDEDPYVPKFQGSNYGYNSGAYSSNVIEKFPFSADTNASDVGDLTTARYDASGQSSSDYGYTSGGTPASNPTNVIDKFPFATDANASDVGDLTASRFGAGGQSSAAYGYGYTSGGWLFPGYSNTIDRFSFSSDGNATGAGNLSIGRYKTAGQSSTDYGYDSAGYNPTYPYAKSRIYKFPFASTFSYTSTVGSLTVSRIYSPAGQSSTDYGYNSGGYSPPYSNVIDKFPFASDANATDVGDLTIARYAPAGQSSEDYGYTSGGIPVTDRIDKFPFASDANATDVGNLTSTKYKMAGQQY